MGTRINAESAHNLTSSDDEQRRDLTQRFDADIPTTADTPPFYCGCHNMRSPFIGITVVFLVIFSLVVVPRISFLPAH